MRAGTRNIFTAGALVYVASVGYLFSHVPLRTFNLLLVTVALPLVWLIWAFARWSANQHANRWARDIAKAHGSRPVRGERVR